MSRPVLTLELPEDLYERVRRTAKGMNQPVEEALVNIVRAATPSLEKVPAEYRAELEAMEPTFRTSRLHYLSFCLPLSADVNGPESPL